MAKRCFVPGCDQVEAKRYRFPNPHLDVAPELYKMWLERIQSPIINAMCSREEIYTKVRICKKHFAEDCFSAGARSLNFKSVPTLFLPLQISEDNKPQLEPQQLPTSTENYQQEEVPCKVVKIDQDDELTTSGTSTSTKSAYVDGPRETARASTSEKTESQGVFQMVEEPQPSTSAVPTTTEVHAKPTTGSLEEIICNLDEVTPAVVEEKLKSHFCQETVQFLKKQCRSANQEPNDHIFTLKEKILCLGLYKKGIKTYQLFHKLFNLPSSSTLENFLGEIPLYTGVNQVIFEHLAQISQNLNSTNKYCALIYDEISLTAGVNFDVKRDILSGFLNFGEENEPLFADHALVFMLRGLADKWKYPLGYFFCQGTTSTPRLVRCIRSVIGYVQAAGFQVVASVCDQSITNVAANNELRQQTITSYLRQGREFHHHGFEVNGRVIFQIYDPPHLMKALRNNLLTKNLTFKLDRETVNFFPDIITRHINFNTNEQTFTAKWTDIVKFYLHDRNMFKVYSRNLTEIHVYGDKTKKTNVKHAIQVLSFSVGAGIASQICEHELTDEAWGTALACLFFDKLFDSVNGSEIVPSNENKPLKSAISNETSHIPQWELALKILKSMNFTAGSQSNISPAITNWIFTLQSIKELWNFLKDHEFESLNLRLLNQDPLENFFGQIYALEGNTKISCLSFQSSFKTLLLHFLMNSKIIQFPSFNCEDDCSKSLGDLKTFIQISNQLSNRQDEKKITNLTLDYDIVLTNYLQIIYRDYLFRSIAKDILTWTLCNECWTNLTQSNILTQRTINNLINKNTYFTTVTDVLLDMTIRLLLTQCHVRGIKGSIINFIRNNVEIMIGCSNHNFNIQFIDLTVTKILFLWCKSINCILKGIDTRNYEQIAIIKEAQRYCHKHKTKKV